MEKCLSNVLVAYSYHHKGVMTKGVLCIYKAMVTVNDLMTMLMNNIRNEIHNYEYSANCNLPH